MSDIEVFGTTVELRTKNALWHRCQVEDQGRSVRVSWKDGQGAVKHELVPSEDIMSMRKLD